jgi:hypothetical protein
MAFLLTSGATSVTFCLLVAKQPMLDCVSNSRADGLGDLDRADELSVPAPVAALTMASYLVPAGTNSTTGQYMSLKIVWPGLLELSRGFFALNGECEKFLEACAPVKKCKTQL